MSAVIAEMRGMAKSRIQMEVFFKMESVLPFLVLEADAPYVLPLFGSTTSFTDFEVHLTVMIQPFLILFERRW